MGQADLVDQLQRPLPELTHLAFGAPEPHAQAGGAGQGKLKMLKAGELVKQAGDLEGSRDPEAGDLLWCLAGDVLAAVCDRA